MWADKPRDSVAALGRSTNQTLRILLDADWHEAPSDLQIWPHSKCLEKSSFSAQRLGADTVTVDNASSRASSEGVHLNHGPEFSGATGFGLHAATRMGNTNL